MKKKFITAILALLLMAGLFGFFRTRFFSPPRKLEVSGNIETDTVDLSFKIPGRLIKRFVDEGDSIKKGELIAKLDSTQLQEQVAQFRAQVQTAKAAYDELLAGSRAEDIAAAKEAVRRQAAVALNAKANDNRLRQLYEKDLVSAQAYDQAETDYKSAEALLRQSREHLRLLLNGPRPEEIEQARTRLEAAKASLAEVQTMLDDANLFSPISGLVLSKNAEPGEYVFAGTPVVTAANLQNIWVRAYLDESDLGLVKYGQPAEVTTDTYPGKLYPGTVSFISPEAEFTPKNIQTQKERVKLVYRIKITVDNPNLELKPGMPADAVLQSVFLPGTVPRGDSPLSIGGRSRTSPSPGKGPVPDTLQSVFLPGTVPRGDSPLSIGGRSRTSPLPGKGPVPDTL